MVLCRSVIPSAIMAVALVTVAGIVRAADDLPKAGKQVGYRRRKDQGHEPWSKV